MFCLCLGLLLSFASCDEGSNASDSITADDCDRARQHAAELRVQGLTFGSASPESAAVMRESHRANLASAGGAAYLSQCQETRTLAWLECTLGATSIAELSRCEGS